MPSLRQYTNKSVIAQIADIDEANISDSLLNRAEMMIDSYIADFYEGSFSKIFKGEVWLETSNATFTDTTLTITPNSGNSDNYWTYTVIELLSGSQKGLIIPVISSTGNVLTFDSVTGLTGQVACRIYQLGKFPMYKDCSTYKSIPREVIEAVAYQVEFMLNEGKKLNKPSKKSESIGENYSYTNEDSAMDTIENRMSPIAKDILRNAGYTAQTI